ncbi:MAG: hypothetical protein KF718_03980 [Polyangiaceae bacterium]|nr:hypothetical protein [Polyangiaceae bacterium]
MKVRLAPSRWWPLLPLLLALSASSSPALAQGAPSSKAASAQAAKKQLAATKGALAALGSARHPGKLDGRSRLLFDQALRALAEGKHEAAQQSLGELLRGRSHAEARNLGRYLLLRSYHGDALISSLAGRAHRTSAQRAALNAHHKALLQLRAKTKAEPTLLVVPILKLLPTGPDAFSKREVELEVTRDDVEAAVAHAKERLEQLAQADEVLLLDLQSALAEKSAPLQLATRLLKAFDETAASVTRNVR